MPVRLRRDPLARLSWQTNAGGMRGPGTCKVMSRSDGGTVWLLVECQKRCYWVQTDAVTMIQYSK
jgi:hypothetical protein